MSSTHSLTRRDFIKVSTATVATLTLGNSLLLPQSALGYSGKDQINPNIDNTRVVYVHDNAMTNGTEVVGSWFKQNEVTNDDVVAVNIDKMACALAQQATPAEAWKKIFQKPANKNWDSVVVAIKTNNIAQQHSRNTVIKQFCETLIKSVGITPANIHIYDACHGGDMNEKTPWTKLPAGVKVESAWGGSNTTIPVPPPWNRSTKCVQSIADGTVDILINIALCKGHSNGFGGFTMCMKNHYGTCSPDDHNGADFLIGINKSEAIVGKIDPATGKLIYPRQQLCFIDALWASQPGPGGLPTVRPNRFFMGTFAPVLDYVVAKRFRNEAMGWKINERTVDRFLSEFGYSESDLVNGGKMIDAVAWKPGKTV